VETDLFQSAGELAGRALRIEPVEEIAAALLIDRAVADHLPHDGKNPVRNGYVAFFSPRLRAIRKNNACRKLLLVREAHQALWFRMRRK
jgi:hypothetical protein